MTPLLELNAVNKQFGQNRVLDEVSLTVNAGEVIVILGPSGCGKSTLLRTLNGLESIQGGDIRFDGERLDANTDWQRLRQRIGMVFQSYHLFPNLTVLENVLLGPLQVQKRERQEALLQAEQLLTRIGLWERRHDYPRQLSGGQQQRIAIVRALCMNPQVMLFDEVTAALDPEMVQEVLEVIRDLAGSGMTLLIVTHELAFAQAVADRIVFMDGGHILEQAAPHQFFENPRSQRARQFLAKFSYTTVIKRKESA
ncbi:TPA: amino acid ABC transporter ATP-binding protein [Aeromonas hydrophila]|jgi:polar amino acid transport system ATP-binding protein|uniref:amino acid ABC transporter ATP-binding protein n=1 Tax=Aeromonas hydrophila TaxID=644 RepID=UPI0000324B61|nr:amino acid ABC transporter ATP-binding protein [Aeromonas hydrophila]BDC83897.1 glutamine ABC transporter ATP-binding protein [Aeromonas hydrophila]HAT2490346.1 amino acid ABC transporter ATP-binding protein [Aeromonas hydrophila]HAT2495076.1 amino acid ABC transporter ATP-binding protein [Aeromonas hydrophila]HAT2510548.1 amino acid ABC transporter ATP-binding protein [Aeromonas hydrophila]HAT2530996.1 amino acid ABC transporter ATP-binding protein [Aeromonas hydrophila]